MVRARSLIWVRRRASVSISSSLIAISVRDPSRRARSPPMLRDGVAEQRHRVDGADGRPQPPVFEELQAAGMTEWLGRVHPLGELCRRSAVPPRPSTPSGLGLVFSVSTDRPGGFLDYDVRFCARRCRFSRGGKGHHACAAIGDGLLAAYLGNDPASRILAGTVLRGEVQSVDAVVFFTDLQGFTALADITPGRELIACSTSISPAWFAGHAAQRRGAEVHGRRHAGGFGVTAGDPRRGLPAALARPTRRWPGSTR